MDIRKEFLEFFKNNDHLILPSSGLIPDNDSSVLLTTAGMQQFKPYYLGIKKPPYPRISTVQKCFRTSDIERIGDTERHLTFFEMLGNFAFADYFKKEAISLALDFILNILKIPENKLYFTVFGGNGELPIDEDARKYWISNGIKSDRIFNFGMKDNFWGPAGTTGPCGPSTEIYYDFGQEFGCGSSSCNPNCDCGRYIEIWNLVFTQYNFDSKNYRDLPNKNIDTGMGLERIYAVASNSTSVYRTPLFFEILKKLKEITGKELKIKIENNDDINTGKALKIISDHSRSIYFLISDGVMPSNEGRGYILRRIIRRAIRFGRVLGINDYFLNEIGSVIIDQYRHAYPELLGKKGFAFQIVSDEEKRFSNTLKEGNRLLSASIADLKKKNDKFLDPNDAFRLYETYGFPVELTKEILAENNLLIDMEKINLFMKKHVEDSKEKTVFDKKIIENIDDYKAFSKEIECEFAGYEKTETSSKIIKILKNEGNKKIVSEELTENESGEIVLNKTPFYGEKGGEIGDKGLIVLNDESVFIVEDTRIPVEGIFTHNGFVKKGKFKLNDNVQAKVDIAFRKAISKNHTATHLLHWALRSLYGKEAAQAGSFVTDSRIRFDYNFFGEPENEMILRLENLINKKIQDNNIVKIFETTKEYAEEIGAVALFEEKYGKFVRVVEIDDYSRELCGGIHVKHTGEIGLFKITGDFGIGSNLRRIEAVTGFTALNFLNEKNGIVKEASEYLGVSDSGIIRNILNLKTSIENLNIKLEHLTLKIAKSDVLNKYPGSFKSEDLKIILFDFSNLDYRENLSAKTIGVLSDEIKDHFKNENIFIALANNISCKPVLIFNSSKDLIEKGINCSVIAKETGKIIGGGGGGKPDFAQSGGSDPALIGKAFEFLTEKIKNILK
ncbi:MAG: alanine--tRNA ligase [Candidatus Humimicrobiaceae bacterium]